MAEAVKNRLKQWIYQTNDPHLLERYYDTVYDEMTESERDRMERRLMTAFAMDAMVSRVESQRGDMLIDVPVFGVQRTGNRTVLVGVLPDERNGVFAEETDDPLAIGWHQLFRSRGVNFSPEELSLFSEEYYPKCVMHELVQRVIPHTDVQMVKLPPYDSASKEERGKRDRSEYQEHRVQAVRDTVLEAVQKWRSPVLLTVGGETVTVVGMDDGEILYVDEGPGSLTGETEMLDVERLLDDRSGALSNLIMIYMTEAAATE